MHRTSSPCRLTLCAALHLPPVLVLTQNVCAWRHMMCTGTKYTGLILVAINLSQHPLSPVKKLERRQLITRGGLTVASRFLRVTCKQQRIVTKFYLPSDLGRCGCGEPY
eukprot:scaffold167578_cov28-Tisochrysis_lutea.AAC.1